MKKFLLCLAVLFSLTLCFGSKSLAYTGPTGNTYQYEYVFTEGGSTLRFYSNYLFFGCSQETNSGRPYLCAYIPANENTASDLSNYYVTDVTTGRNTYYMYNPYKRYPSGTVTGQNVTWTTWAELKYNNGQSTANWRVNWTTAIFQAAGVPVFSTYQAGAEWAYSEMQPDIDWDNPLYSANIPTPQYEITYRTLSSTPIVDVPLNVNVTNGRESLYIEVKACFELPRRIYVDYDRQFGRYVYSGASRSLAVWEDIIDKENLRASNNTSVDYIHTQLVSAWQDNYDAVSLTDDDWYFSDLIFSGTYSTIKARYANLRKVCCFYGNQMKLMVRYFTIQNDTQFVVGAWRVWENSDPTNFYDELPEYYEPYFPASGNSGTLITVESTPDPETIIPPGSGTPTGTYYTPGINITVGQNVPNYPDYPTIRSYNADNFLVKTMNYLDYLDDPDTSHDLFGEFGNFCQSIFVFIPGDIWTIIAVGFCLVIVVMFLKIL